MFDHKRGWLLKDYGFKKWIGVHSLAKFKANKLSQCCQKSSSQTFFKIFILIYPIYFGVFSFLFIYRYLFIINPIITLLMYLFG